MAENNGTTKWLIGAVAAAALSVSGFTLAGPPDPPESDIVHILKPGDSARELGAEFDPDKLHKTMPQPKE